VGLLNEARDIFGERFEFYLGLGLSYYRLHRFDKAEESLKAALALKPADTNAHYLLFLTYRDSKQSAKALTTLEKWLKLNPKDRRARELMGTVTKDRGDEKKQR